MTSKPDFGVYGLALDGEHWKKCGVAWVRKKRSASYISVALDFIPRGGQLAIWPTNDTDEIELPKNGEETP